MINYTPTRVLIWGKTYPELSVNHVETVCTGGVLEDGSPVRLYPIPFRYLEGEQKFTNYQWVTLNIAKDPRDNRPESYHVQHETPLTCHEKVDTDSDEWGARSVHMFKDSTWQFGSVDELIADEQKTGRSIGIVEPKEILGVRIRARSEDERIKHEKKYEDQLVRNAAQRAQLTMFDDYTVPELKALEYVDSRLEVHWLCHAADCRSHRMQVLDWGLIELQKNKGIDKAKAKLVEILNPETHSPKFFLGNSKAHREAFMIVGIWYPQKPKEQWLF